MLSAPTPLPFLGHDDDDLVVHSEAPTSQQTLHWCVCVCGARPDPCQSTRAWTMCHCSAPRLSTTAARLAAYWSRTIGLSVGHPLAVCLLRTVSIS